MVPCQERAVVPAMRSQSTNAYDRADGGTRAIARWPLPFNGVPRAAWQDRMGMLAATCLVGLGQQRLARQLVPRVREDGTTTKSGGAELIVALDTNRESRDKIMENGRR